MNNRDKAESWMHGWLEGVGEYVNPEREESLRACQYYRAGFKRGQQVKYEAGNEAVHAFGIDPWSKEGGAS